MSVAMIDILMSFYALLIIFGLLFTRKTEYNTSLISGKKEVWNSELKLMNVEC